MQKTCQKCGQTKDIIEFAKNKSVKDGYRNQCKKCHNLYFRNYYDNKNNLEKHMKIVYDRKKKIRWNLGEYKKQIGCQICGYNKCVRALHFHHKDKATKSFGVSICGSVSYENLDSEIKKCIVVCANCHYEIEDGLISI